MKEKVNIAHFIGNLENLEQEMLRCQTTADLSNSIRRTTRMLARIQVGGSAP